MKTADPIQTQATPGPWVASQAVRGQDCGSHIHTAANPHGIPLAHVYSRDAAEANARLIAAAPDLLAMLERLSEKTHRANAIRHSGGMIENEDWSELYQITNEARAAIFKATITT